MRLLLLDNYDSFTWNLYHSLARVNADVKVLRNDSVSLEEASVFDALVISPGPGLPQESGRLMEILALFAGRKPVLGICLGHQAIAMHFGATLLNLDRVVHGKERECRVTDPEDPVYRDIGDSFIAGRYHSWIIDPDTIPPGLLVTSTDSEGRIMSFRHRLHACWGLQYHPESVMTPMGNRIIENWLKHISP